MIYCVYQGIAAPTTDFNRFDMKSRKKRYSSSSASAESGDSEESSEASQSAESGESDSGSQRARRRKRRADSTDSESEDEDARKKAKKRKHKKKKKKHGKKRKRDRSASEEEASSESEGERKKKHKHKHSHKHKRERSASPSVEEVPVREERIEDRARSRLQSVVKERHQSGGVSSHHRSASPPQERHHRYYHQKEYERSASVSEGDYEERRRDDVDKFYRGSSKDRSVREGDRGRAGRDERYQREQRYEGGDRYTERYTGHEYSNNKGPEEYPHTRRPRDYDEYNNRTSKYDDRGGGKFEEEYTRGEPHFRERRDNREFNPRYQHEDRLEKKPYDKGPLCLVCGETHIGQQCRRRLPERPRERDYGASRDYGGTRDYRPDKYEPKRVPEKRERERDRPEREERARPSGEHRERSRQRSPHKAASRERKSPPRRISPSRGEAVRGEGERGGGERGRSRERARDKKGEEEKVPEKRERPPREGDRETRRPSRDRRDKKSRFNAEEGKSYSWGKTEVKKEEAPADKDKPDFGLSGKLAADTNMVNGILLKYNEPKDAKQPKRRWRFYPFKGDKALPILYIHRQSCFVLGRDHKAVDIPLEHPSVSKQHAALQYRATPYTRPDGTQARRVRPYIIDLDSANGTFVNNKKVEARRFVELLERDVVKFGFSQREYVLLHENSKDDAADDDQEMNGTGGEGGDGGELGEGVTSIAAVKREKQIKHESREDGE